MPYRQNVFFKGGYYHIYNRGAARALLFFNTENYEYCLRLMKKYYRQYGATIIAYCLMPNHYHFLLRQEADQPLSKFVNVIFNAYVQAVNRQQERKGTLFEGRFHQIQVDREEYLAHLCRYIHLNPVKAKLVAPEEWIFSNYLEWIGRRAGELTDETFVRDCFPNPVEYQKFVSDYQDELRQRDKITKYFWD